MAQMAEATCCDGLESPCILGIDCLRRGYSRTEEGTDGPLV